MGLFPKFGPVNPAIITTFSRQSMGAQLAGSGGSFFVNGGAYPGANLAFFYPVYLYEAFTVVKMGWVNGTVQVTPGSVDVGVYRPDGTRLVSSGGTLLTTSNTLQEVDVTDTLLLEGLYYLGISCDSVNPRFAHVLPSTVLEKVTGVLQMGSAYPLPANATMVAVASQIVPLFGISERLLVA